MLNQNPTPFQNLRRQVSESIQNHRHDDDDDEPGEYARSSSSQMTHHQPPPSYRTDIGPSGLSGPSNPVGSRKA